MYGVYVTRSVPVRHISSMTEHVLLYCGTFKRRQLFLLSRRRQGRTRCEWQGQTRWWWMKQGQWERGQWERIRTRPQRRELCRKHCACCFFRHSCGEDHSHPQPEGGANYLVRTWPLRDCNRSLHQETDATNTSDISRTIRKQSLQQDQSEATSITAEKTNARLARSLVLVWGVYFPCVFCCRLFICENSFRNYCYVLLLIWFKVLLLCNVNKSSCIGNSIVTVVW